MNGYYITQAEYSLLLGTSHLAFRLYHELRRRMDIRTRRVGQTHPISYRMLIEACEILIPRGAGWQTEKPSLKALRVALVSLERRGLLIQPGEDFIFLLPKAHTISARPAHTGQSKGTTEQPAKAHRYEVLPRTGHDRSAKQGTHQSKQESKEKAAATPPPVDNSSAGETSSAGIAAAFLGQLAKTLPIRYQRNDPLLTRWVESGLTFAELQQAVQAAAAARRRDGSAAPINPGFINAFLPNLGQPHPTDNWQATWSGIEARGRSLGITRFEGESYPALKARILHAAHAHNPNAMEAV